MRLAFSRAPKGRIAQVPLAKSRKSVYNTEMVTRESVAKNPEIITSTFNNKLVLVHKDIKNFAEIEIPSFIESISVQKNKITNFVGLSNLKNLTYLNMEKNPLESFEGFPVLPKLSSIDIRGSPLAKSTNFRVALIILIGRSLQKINGEDVQPTDRMMAKQFPRSTDELLRNGWEMTNIPPKEEDVPHILRGLQKTVKKADFCKTKKSRKIIKLSKYHDEKISEQEKEIEYLNKKVQELEGNQ